MGCTIWNVLRVAQGGDVQNQSRAHKTTMSLAAESSLVYEIKGKIYSDKRDLKLSTNRQNHQTLRLVLLPTLPLVFGLLIWETKSCQYQINTSETTPVQSTDLHVV